MKEKWSLRQVKIEGLFHPEDCLARNVKIRSSETREMIEVRNSDLRSERKNVRERINRGKIKYFIFLIHALGFGKWRYFILNIYFYLSVGIIFTKRYFF